MTRFLVPVAAAVAAAGCSGPAVVPVSGRVTLDQADVAEGEIQFVPDNPAQATQAGPIVNGRYELTAPVGRSKVRVNAARKLPKKGEFDYFESIIPERYNEKTELTADVPAGGKADVNFDLKSDKK